LIRIILLGNIPAMKLHNTIYCGDNLEWMRKIPDDTIDLIYADPPFFSNKNYEVIFEDGAEIRSFQDRWKGGINHYVQWMEERCREMHRILKATGSFYLHCDWHAGHYLKVMLDDVFGYNNFRNEIVWCYETGGRAKSFYPKKHDTIFWYSKSNNYKFFYDQVALDRDFSTMHETVFTDKDGKKYQQNKKNGKIYKYYIDNGVLPNDWWNDIQALNPAAKERLGYPTQKPEALLERIICTSSSDDDFVFDPFCGCGTTLTVAHKLGRQWLGIDVSPTACKLIKRRLQNAKCNDIEILGLPMTVKELHDLDPFEFQNWIVGSMGGTVQRRKTGDMGIDGYTYMNREPIQIKQSEHVGRKVVDEFVNALNRHYKKAKLAAQERHENLFIMKGIIVAFSFTKGAFEEVARLKREEDIEIELMTVKDVISEFK